jgi:hypothetical protein
MACSIRLFAVLALLLTPAVVNGAEKEFEVAAERLIPPVPFNPGYSGSSRDGKSWLIVNAGRLTVRPLESRDETELMPPGSIYTGSGSAWASWSADGKWIYYLQRTDKPGINDYWRIDIANRRKELVIKNAGGVTSASPQPSPDGKSIVFYRGSALMLADTAGGHERLVCEKCGTGRFLVWSPDSSRILLATGFDPARGTRLSLLTVATSQLKVLGAVDGIANSMVWPSWGSGFFVCSWQYSRAQQTVARKIWYLNLPGGQPTLVTKGPSNYSALLGATADSGLVAQRLPAASGWDFFGRLSEVVGLSETKPPSGPATVILTLKK